MHPLPAGARPNVDNNIADPFRFRRKYPILACHPDSHGIHQRIGVIGRIEFGFASEGRNTNRIAVPPDSFYHPARDIVAFRIGQIPQPQCIDKCDRASPHGEYIAQDATNPRGRALVGNNITWMIMALHFERNRISVV